MSQAVSFDHKRVKFSEKLKKYYKFITENNASKYCCMYVSYNMVCVWYIILNDSITLTYTSFSRPYISQKLYNWSDNCRGRIHEN